MQDNFKWLFVYVKFVHSHERFNVINVVLMSCVMLIDGWPSKL